MDHIKNSPDKTECAPPVSMALRDPNELNTLSPWEVAFRQIEAGAMETKATVRIGPTVTLMKFSMSRAVHQTGISPPGMFTFGLMRADDVSVWQGHGTSSAEMISFGSSDPFDGVSTSRFCAIAISIAEQNVESLADALGLDIPTSLRATAISQSDGLHGRLTAIRRYANVLTRKSAPAMTLQIEEAIVAGLLLAANSDDRCEDKSDPLARSRAVSKATELMFANLDENIPISRICHEVGVSWRTLDRAFSEKFGVGPKRYYLRARLNRVRSDLIKKPSQGRVSDIANSWGFWHLGQFAQDYYNMFRELPSDTVTGKGRAPLPEF